MESSDRDLTSTITGSGHHGAVNTRAKPSNMDTKIQTKSMAAQCPSQLQAKSWSHELGQCSKFCDLMVKMGLGENWSSNQLVAVEGELILEATDGQAILLLVI